MLAGWDQTAFRQTVVDGYGWGMSLLRLLAKAAPRWLGVPDLPRPGETLRYLTAAFPVEWSSLKQCSQDTESC
jgi:hypothetical protein